MSRTRKDRNNQYRIIKNSFLKKKLSCYSEDIIGRKKNRKLSRLVRKRLKKETYKEIIGADTNVGSEGGNKDE